MRRSGWNRSGSPVAHRHEHRLHQAAAAIVVVGIQAHPDQCQQPDHTSQQHKFSHGAGADACNVARMSSGTVATDADSGFSQLRGNAIQAGAARRSAPDRACCWQLWLSPMPLQSSQAGASAGEAAAASQPTQLSSTLLSSVCCSQPRGSRARPMPPIPSSNPSPTTTRLLARRSSRQLRLTTASAESEAPNHHSGWPWEAWPCSRA